MEKQLADKVAVITGGNAGIGRAIAQKYAEHGAKVVIFGRNAERGEAVAAECGGDFVKVDVANHKEMECAIKQVIDQHGRVDILVNNAGVSLDALLMRMSEEQWDTVIDTNLKAAFNSCKAVARPMMKARSGKIINVSSVIGLIGNAGQSHYAASKAGLIGLSKSLAKEFASRGIHVNCIAPGFIKTPMTDVLSDEQQSAIMQAIPFNRMGSPEEIANVALFLAGPYSSYITGQVITVDGGMVM